MYKYELHCHTARTSACSSLSAEDMVELYLANGYDGLVVTDHFLNGNTTVHRELPDGTYEQKVELFCKGYEGVKEAAKGRLNVFFGLEVSYLGTDVLVYGADKESLKAFPEIPSMDLRSFADFCREKGFLAVQAHPFREAPYIDHIRLYPGYEGVEVRNATCNARCNALGLCYAEAYGKVKMGGSDLHHANQKMISGMAFDEKAETIEQLMSLIRSGTGEVIFQPNQYKKV